MSFIAFQSSNPLLCSQKSASHPLLCSRSIRFLKSKTTGVVRMTSAHKPASNPETSTTAKPFSWTEQWYPLAWADDIPDGKPLAITLWQRHYVLFRDGLTGEYVVMDDICPHRAAPLSEGRLYERETAGRRETVLECGYHGWRFACSGKCIDIPVAELEKRIPGMADVGGVYATYNSKCGLVFMWLGKRELADVSTVPIPRELDMEREDLVWFRNSRRKFPLAFTTIQENVADPAHVSWAHHGSGQGNRNAVKRDGGSGGVLEEDRVEEGYARVAFRRTGKANSPSGMPKAASFCELIMPSYVGFKIISEKTSAFLLTWLVPVDHEECIMFTTHAISATSAVTKFLLRLKPRWMHHMTTNLILDGDAVLLQGQENRLQSLTRDGYGGAWKKKYCLASGRWDTQVVKLREFLDMYGASMPFATGLNGDHKVLNRELINDRYENHTKDCACCAPALKNIKRGLVTALIVAGLCGMSVVFAGVLLAGIQGGGVARRKVWGIALGGLVGCAVALGAARFLDGWRCLLTYTNIAYELSHAE